MTTTVLARLTPDPRVLTASQFQGLAEIPPALEWFTNLRNPRTREAYQLDLQDRHGASRGLPPDHPGASARLV
jgi:hypothetical protein